METVEEIAAAVSDVVKKRCPECDVILKEGGHDGIPVEYEGKPIATITVECPDKSFTDDEIGLIRAIAEKIGGPSSKALSLGVARREATIAKLTRLANRLALDVGCASLA